MIPQDTAGSLPMGVLMNFSILLHSIVIFPLIKQNILICFVGRNGRTLNKIKTPCHVSLRIMQCILSFQLAPRGGVTKTC